MKPRLALSGFHMSMVMCCNRRCRDETAAGWATVSLDIRFHTTRAHTTAHCHSLWLMCTHAYICGHMRTHRDTHRDHTCRHMCISTHREKLTKSLLQHLFTINNLQLLCCERWCHVTHTHSLYTNIFFTLTSPDNESYMCKTYRTRQLWEHCGLRSFSKRSKLTTWL